MLIKNCFKNIKIKKFFLASLKILLSSGCSYFIKKTFLFNNVLSVRRGEKAQLTAAIFLLLAIIISGFFIFSSFSLRQVALALTGNYSKSPSDSLDSTDWNNLPNDFLDKSGDTMTGQLNMSSNKIVNLADPTSNTEAANKQYVDSVASTAGGAGAIFVNWGNTDCPGAAKLYDGYGFGTRYNNISGGSNSICIQAGDAGSYFNTAQEDRLYPLVTGETQHLPTEIARKSFVKCAVCYKNNSTCLESYGSWTCNSLAGFSSVYNGYALGDISNFLNRHSTERRCVNRNFDDELSPTWGAMWYGSRIQENFGLSEYDSDIEKFVKCAICCN